MKSIIKSLPTLLFTYTHLCGQGTFLYDQQSVTNDSPSGQGAQNIQAAQPVGQSFTPTLSAIGFVRLNLSDDFLNGIGATLYVNLRSNSITGPILASTKPVFMPDGFSSVTNFFFASHVPLASGTTYYLQPIIQSGDSWSVIHDTHYNYTGGTAFGLGQPAPDYDLWFREGIIIPEPSAAMLLLLGAAALVYGRRRRPRLRSRP